MWRLVIFLFYQSPSCFCLVELRKQGWGSLLRACGWAMQVFLWSQFVTEGFEEQTWYGQILFYRNSQSLSTLVILRLKTQSGRNIYRPHPTPLKILTFFFKKNSFRYTIKLKGRYRDFPYIPCPYTCIASSIINITHQNDLLFFYYFLKFFILKDDSSLTHHKHPKTIVYFRL